MSTPLLSVCIITYNHEKYIRQAIEGVLMQKVNFDWEIIIADDCSTDNTRAIIMEYKEKHPDLIKFIFQEKNVGAAQNWFDLITTPKSKYIAYFEGDDYWTDPLKLQKQVNFLETNIKYSLTIHNVQKINYDNTMSAFNDKLVSQAIDFEKLLKYDIGIPSCSWVYRNNFVVPSWLLECEAGDWPMLYVLLSRGNCYYFSDVMGVYRKHDGGVTKEINKTNYHLIHINLLKLFNKNENHNYKKEVNRGLGILYIKAFIYDRVQNKFKYNLLFNSFKHDFMNLIKFRKKYLFYWIFIYKKPIK